MVAPQIVHIQNPISDFSARIRVPFRIEQTDTGRILAGHSDVIETADRVWVETSVEGEVVSSNKLDPNIAENEYDVVREEVLRIDPFQLPVTSQQTEAAAAVVHAYVSAGRPEWD